MDTQIRIRKEIYYGDDKRVINSNLNLLQNKEAFSFKESDDICIYFEFDESLYEIEYEAIDGEMISLHTNEGITSYGSDERECYYTGNFALKIAGEHTVYNSYFFVEPRNTSYDRVLELRDYVNNFCLGLSQNKNRMRQASLLNNEEVQNHYIFLKESLSKLMNSIQIYLSKHYEESVKETTLSRSYKKMNAASTKWLVQKGAQYNTNIHEPDTMLIKRTRFTDQNAQNIYFKEQLYFWNEEVKKMMDVIDGYCKHLEEDIEKLDFDIAELKKNVELYQQEKQISKKIISNNEKSLTIKLNERTSKQDILYSYQSELTIIRHYKINLEYDLYNTWIKNIRRDRNINIRIKDSSLKVISNIHNEYIMLKNQHRKQNSKHLYMTFGEKSTPKLFETYIYCMLINLLKDLGYSMIQDISQEDMQFYFSDTSVITMCKDEMYCDIIYDYSLPKSNSDFTHNDYCYINSFHNKPDFILSFYEKNNNPYDAIIIEAKWRPLRNIYSEVEDTETVLHLKDYFNIAYHNESAKRKTQRGIISQVILLYPDDNERIIEIQDDEIQAMGMMATKDVKQTNTYISLKEQITYCIETHN